MSFGDDLVALIPVLKKYALHRCRDEDRANDLVQETCFKALRSQDLFEEGTNLTAWLITILRNVDLTDLRKRSREVPDPDGLIAEGIEIPPSQFERVFLSEVESAIAQMPEYQRHVLLLVSVEGASYETAAQIAGIPVGTAKSRVNRARKGLTKALCASE